MAGNKKKHHLDRPALPASHTAFRWQVPHLRALLVLFQLYPDLTNGDRKSVMWQLFPELQARGYEEGHFYDQYQPRWSASRSSKAWQAVEKPNPKSADIYTPQDLADHADMIRQVQAAAEALEIDLRPVSPPPAFARSAFSQPVYAVSGAARLSALPPSFNTTDHPGDAEPQDFAMANGQSGGDYEQVGGELVRTASGNKDHNSPTKTFPVRREFRKKGPTGGPVRKPHMSDLVEEEHSGREFITNFSITRKGVIERAVMGSLLGHADGNHLPMFHHRNLTLANGGTVDARFEVFPLTHEPDATQLAGDLGLIDPECDIYKFGGRVIQVTSMPEERTFAAMVCNTDVCKFCNPTLGAAFQISRPSPTNGMPFVHTALDLGKLHLDHDQRTTYFMYDPLPQGCEERQGVSAASAYVPDELLPANVRANWPTWGMMRCVLGHCTLCSDLVGNQIREKRAEL